MKKRLLGVRYLDLVTKQPWFFSCVILFGVALFIYLTLTTKIETDAGTQTLFHMIIARAGRGL